MGGTATTAPVAERPISILIVDDSAMMRTMIKRVVSMCDLPIGELFEAGNGAEALRVLETNAVQALFTDINMPVMNGTELLREIARRDDWRELVRVIISTDASAARRAEVDGLGVRCYIEKPFSPEVMRDVLVDLAVR